VLATSLSRVHVDPKRLRGWWPYTPLLLTAIYLITLALKFDHLVAWTYQSADAASAPVIGQLFGTAGSHVTLGDYAWYWSLMFELATRWIPDHREIWEAVPYLLVLIGAGLSVNTVYRVAGAIAASLTATILLCGAPLLLYVEMPLNDHTPTWACLAILGWWLVALERGHITGRRSLCALAVVVIGAIVGPEAASDPLLIISGVLPFAAVVAVLRVFGDRAQWRHAVVPALSTVAAIGVGWFLTGALMSALHVVKDANAVTTFASNTQVNTNLLDLLWQCIAIFGNGSFFSQSLKLTSALELVCALLALGSVALLPRIGWLELRRGQVPRAGSPDALRLALIGFWVLSAILLSLAYVTSSAPVDYYSSRYLVGLVYAVAVVIPVICVRSRVLTAIACLGTCVYALSGVIGMIQGQVFSAASNLPSEDAMSAIIGYAQKHDLHLGYSGYWDGAPITWASHMRLDVYPVSTCGSSLCDYYQHTISNWYTQKAKRTFLITDSAIPLVPSPPSALGPAVAQFQVDELTLYVYDYNIASKIGP
jgi:hypothetical protein